MKNLLTLILIILVISCTQSTERPFAVSDIKITWSAVENQEGTYTSTWKILNEGSSVFPATGWTIYYNQVAGVPVDGSISGSLNITQISGTLYGITPGEAFKALGEGESTSLGVQCGGFALKVTDAPSGLYLVLDGKEPQLIDNYEIGQFPPPQQLKRGSKDNVPIPTTELRYKQNEYLSLVSHVENPAIIPTPQNVIVGSGNFIIPQELLIGFQQGLKEEALLLKEKFEATRRSVSITDNPGDGHIRLSIGSFSLDQSEHYRMVISENHINIEGSDPAGVFYATQSLISLWPLEGWGEKKNEFKLKCQTILDGPRFPYRGLYLDVARNFQQPDVIKKTLDMMAFYKLNKLMFGVSNDEGWRLEIKGIPELTEIGSKRGHTEDETDHLLPAYGSGPFADAENNYGSGHYSREEFIDILKYAQERHIEVIPEINFPGHARAAIKSMEARTRRIMESGSDEPTYRLHDPDDQSAYKSVQGYNDNVICPCQESVYQFLEAVVSELVSMYQEAGVKFTTVHTGGDEVPAGIWEASPICIEFLKNNPQLEGIPDLPGYFIQRYHEILEQHQLTTAGWEEIAMHKVQQEVGGEDNPTQSRKVMVPNPRFSDSNFLPYVWLSIWGVAGEDLAYQLANTGYKVVMCNASNLYFDFAYDKDPLEPGFYWAGLVDTRKPYELVPLDVLQTATVDIMGNPLDMERYEDNVRLTEAGARNIIGLQGELWTETVKGQELLEYYLFPKMLGFVERAWAPDPEWAHLSRKADRLAGLDQAWNGFANMIGQRELARLDHLWGGVNYRVPLPGAVIEEGQLRANVAFPGLEIRYTLDGGEPDENSTLYEGPVNARKPVRLKAFTSTGKASRTSVLSY